MPWAIPPPIGKRRQARPRPSGGGRAPQPKGRAQRHEDSWEQVASWYDSVTEDRGGDFHQHVILPGVLRLLDLKPGERVLDVACGQGVVCRALRQAARVHVTGVDVSPRLIEMARQRSPKEITYLVADARRMSTLRPGSFDAVTWVLAAQNMEPLGPVYGECARLLRGGGRLVMVITHPAFRIPRQSNWRLDEERKLLVRTVDRYLSPLKIPISLHPFKRREPQASMWTYHRPLQDYVNGLAAKGLWTTALEEWPSHKESQPGPMATAENRARQEFPVFLAIRAARVASAA